MGVHMPMHTDTYINRSSFAQKGKMKLLFGAHGKPFLGSLREIFESHGGEVCSELEVPICLSAWGNE